MLLPVGLGTGNPGPPEAARGSVERPGDRALPAAVVQQCETKAREGGKEGRREGARERRDRERRTEGKVRVDRGSRRERREAPDQAVSRCAARESVRVRRKSSIIVRTAVCTHDYMRIKRIMMMSDPCCARLVLDSANNSEFNAEGK
eukprot:3565809-Rhodomonas_salina.1